MAEKSKPPAPRVVGDAEHYYGKRPKIRRPADFKNKIVGQELRRFIFAVTGYHVVGSVSIIAEGFRKGVVNPAR